MSPATSPKTSQPTSTVAVVYSDDSTGPADGDDTGAVATMLRSSAGWNFTVITAGPNGTMSVADALARPEVRLYAQPGADGDDDTAYRRQKRDKSAIKHFVRQGGRYLGICMGGFLAEPGHFNLFRGRVKEYYSSRGASVTTAEPAVIPVIWRDIERAMYFQDGGYMVPRGTSTEFTVLAR
ncbi:MAG: BPL-N domain-containing protein, partial [Pseudonocardiaceae bacterium]